MPCQVAVWNALANFIRRRSLFALPASKGAQSHLANYLVGNPRVGKCGATWCNNDQERESPSGALPTFFTIQLLPGSANSPYNSPVVAKDCRSQMPARIDRNLCCLTRKISRNPMMFDRPCHPLDIHVYHQRSCLAIKM